MEETHLDAAIIAKAVNALFKFQEKKLSDEGKTSLVGFYAKPILAQVFLNEAITKSVIRPRKIKIPHRFVKIMSANLKVFRYFPFLMYCFQSFIDNSMFDTAGEEHAICFFCRSTDKKPIEDYIAEKPINGLTKIISLDEVRKYYVAYKDIKELITQYSHFVCDANVMTQLYNLLGKTFSSHNRQPIPVTYKSPEKLDAVLQSAVAATYMKMKGNVISIRLGLTSMAEEAVAANTKQGLETACLLFDNSWSNVRSINLKTANSPALPIYRKIPTAVSAQPNKGPAEGAVVTPKAAGPTKKGKKVAAVAEDAMDVVSEPVVAIASKGKKGKAAAAAVVEASIVEAAVVEPVVVAAKGKKGKAAAAAVIEAPIVETVAVVEPVVVAAKAKKGKAVAKVAAAKEVIAIPEPMAEPVVAAVAPKSAKKSSKKEVVAVEEPAAPVVAPSIAPVTPGKKRGRPAAEAAVEVEEPVSKRSAKKVAKKA